MFHFVAVGVLFLLAALFVQTPGGGVELFSPVDFRVGATFVLNGRAFTVVECDAKTREWYRDALSEEVTLLICAS